MLILQQRLIELRKEKGLSQKELAKKIGVTDSAVCYWETGVNEPKATYIFQLANIYNVSADYLLGLEDDFGVKVTPTTPNAATVAPMSDRLTPDERALLENYRQLNPNFQNVVKQTIEALSDNNSQETVKRNNYK